MIALTLSPLFVRWADAPGMMTSFYRMLITTLVLTPFLVHWVIKNGRLNLTLFVLPIIAGVFTSLDHAFWCSALERTSVANSALLNNISPVWVALFAMIVWHERLNGRFWFALIAVLVGAATVLGSTVLMRPDFALGDALAVISSFFYAGYFIISQKGRRRLDTLPFIWIVTFTAMVCLFLYTRLMGMPLGGYSRETYKTFFQAALISQLGGFFLVTYTLGKLPASIVAPTMVIQPVLSALLAIPLAGEPLMLSQVVGGAVTLGGIYLINTSQNGHKKETEAMAVT